MIQLIWECLKESVHKKFYLISVFVAMFVVFIGWFLGSLTIEEQSRTVFHVACMGAQLFAVVAGAWLASQDINQLISSNYIYLILIKPITRATFFCSRFFALAIGISLGVLLIFGCLSLLVPFHVNYGWVVLGILMEAWIVIALSYFFATWISSPAAAMASVAICFVGHGLPDLKFFAQKTQDPQFWNVFQILNVVIPHFYKLNWRDYEMWKEGRLPESGLFMPVFYSSLWIVVLVSLAILVFQKKSLQDSS